MLELAVAIVLFILAIPTAYAAVIGAPLVLTSKSRVREIIDKAEIKEGDKFYELGTGTGRVMVAVAKYSGAKVIGIELSPLFYLITILNLKINRVKKYELFLENFFKSDLRGADIIFCFLIPRTMVKLKEKFSKELEPGAKVISFAFPIEGWVPYEIIRGGKKPSVYFYRTK